MPFLDRLLAVAKPGYPLAAATIVAGLALTAAGSQAAPERSDKPPAKAAAQRSPAIGCGSGAPGSSRFVVTRPDGGTRAMQLCDGKDGEDLAATAQALSDAIDAEGEDAVFRAHARMPELLSLRLMRDRTHVDPSLTAADRRKNLAAMNDKIENLENEISNSPKAQ